MKVQKRFFFTLAAALILLIALTGAALAVEPAEPIAVQWNGELVSFTDAAPEVVDQRTFLPVRAVLEAMGASVDYDTASSTITAQRNGVTVTMVLGETQATITENGQSRVLEMDVAAYAKNNRTYVPVRFAAEAFGCSVGWDSYEQTVVIVDTDALFGNATFDLMDRFIAYSARQGTPANMSIGGELAAALNDKSGPTDRAILQATGKLDGISSSGGLQLAINLDLSGAAFEESTGLSQVALNSEIRADSQGMLYLNLPPVLSGQDAQTWFSVDLNGLLAEMDAEMAGLTGLALTAPTGTETVSFRDALAAALSVIPLDDSSMSYPMYAEAAELICSTLSDQAFTRQDGGYVSQLVYEDLITATVTLTEQDGDITAIGLTMAAAQTDGSEAVSFDMTIQGTPNQAYVKMELIVADTGMDMELNLELTCVPTDKTAETQPPTGAKIMPLD